MDYFENEEGLNYFCSQEHPNLSCLSAENLLQEPIPYELESSSDYHHSTVEPPFSQQLHERSLLDNNFHRQNSAYNLESSSDYPQSTAERPFSKRLHETSLLGCDLNGETNIDNLESYSDHSLSYDEISYLEQPHEWKFSNNDLYGENNNCDIGSNISIRENAKSNPGISKNFCINCVYQVHLEKIKKMALIENLQFSNPIKLELHEIEKKIILLLHNIWKRIEDGQILNSRDLQDMLSNCFGKDNISNILKIGDEIYEEFENSVCNFIDDLVGVYPLVKLEMDQNEKFLEKISRETNVLSVTQDGLFQLSQKPAKDILDALIRSADNILKEKGIEKQCILDKDGS